MRAQTDEFVRVKPSAMACLADSERDETARAERRRLAKLPTMPDRRQQGIHHQNSLCIDLRAIFLSKNTRR